MTDQKLAFSRADFAQDFRFGVATSSYQIEGHAFGGAGRTHWDDFAATKGNVAGFHHGEVACDHYHLYEQDLDLVKQAGFDSYRFSTSWARVLPEGCGQINQAGLDFYDRLVDAMQERGLEPWLTLYHWELPASLADLGGWRNRDIANWFADYTEIVINRLGDRLHAVAPINEPWCVAWLGHYYGEHAPGLRDIRATSRAMHHILLSHGRAIEVMRAMGQKNLGCVFNQEWATPADETEETQRARALYDASYNRFFLQGVFKQSYPDILLQHIESHLPANWQDDFGTIAQELDWCGLNYYTRKNIAYDPAGWPHQKFVEGPLEKTQVGWEIYPDALYEFLTRTMAEFTGDLPIYVTENGSANHDVVSGGVVHDEARIKYLNQHLKAAHKAMGEGVPLKGYFIWSLLDNYEWALGYEPRFGLVHVDYETQKRTPKQSYYALQSALRR